MASEVGVFHMERTRRRVAMGLVWGMRPRVGLWVGSAHSVIWRWRARFAALRISPWVGVGSVPVCVMCER